MEFWDKLIAALKQKGFGTVQNKKLQEAFGHLDASGLLSLSEDQLLPYMTGRTVAIKREKVDTLRRVVQEIEVASESSRGETSIRNRMNDTKLDKITRTVREKPDHDERWKKVETLHETVSETKTHEVSHMTLPGYLQITAGGEDAPVLSGEDNTQSHLGATDVSEWLECSAFEVALETVQQSSQSTGLLTGPIVWRPASFVVRVGKSTPWLFEAVRMKKSVDLVLHLFTIKQETGVIEQYFQYRIQTGRIVSIRLIQPDIHDPATSRLPHRVEFSVMPRNIEVESITGGTEMVDDWSNRGT